MTSIEWKQPKPLNFLRTVDPMRESLIPEPLRAWVTDTSRILQTPLEYATIPVLAAVGALLGHRACLSARPDGEHTIVPNMWGLIVGEPSSRKSPALSKALAPYRALAARHIDLDGAEKAPRFTCNDATQEALAQLLVKKTDGRILLATFDEIADLTDGFRRQGREKERQFYIEAWEGKVDRYIDRKVADGGYIPRVALGIVGATQPDHAKEMLSGRSDGFVARFGLVAWPDRRPRDPDAAREPIDKAAKARVFELFQRLDESMPKTIEVGGLPCVVFDREAQATWDSFMDAKVQRSEDETLPLMVRHWVGKSDGTVGALSLAIEAIMAADKGRTFSAVSSASLINAIDLVRHFGEHARRWFRELDPGTRAAELLASKLESGHWRPKPDMLLEVRKLQQNRWWLRATPATEIRAGLAILERHCWVRLTEDRRAFYVNPVVIREGR